MRSLLAITAAVAAAGFSTVAPERAEAAVVTIANPGGSGVIGARIRWGGTGWEAGIRSSTYCPLPNPNACATMNPTGTPTWQVGQAYGFRVEYTTDGNLSLAVDFDRSGGFGAGESISYNFAALNGLAFDYLQVFGNDGTGTAESALSDLVINGTSIVGGLASGAASSTDTFYNDTSGGATPWLITGNLTFLTAGTAGENPSWNFNFRSPGSTAAVPLPGTLALGGLALLMLGALRRRA